MAKLTPVEFRQRWAERMAASGAKTTAGVNSVTEAPSQKAIAQKQKMVTNWTRSITDGTWEQRLGKVTLAQWKQDMIDKGIPRMQQSVSTARTQQKVERLASELLAFQDQNLPAIQAMASTTLEDNIARATAWMRKMSEFKFSG